MLAIGAFWRVRQRRVDTVEETCSEVVATPSRRIHDRACNRRADPR